MVPVRLLVLLTLLATPVAAEAQHTPTLHRIAVLHLTAPTPAFESFREGMLDLGWREGQAFVIDYRSADGHGERLDELAAQVVQSRPAVIVTGVTSAALAAKRATSTIPVVMAISSDPTGLGLVTSLARPGGNITGQAIFAPELSVKRLELLREALPRVPRIAIFWNAGAGRESTLRHLKATQVAAQALGVQLHEIEIPGPEAIDAAFLKARQARAGAILTIQGALFYAVNRQVAELSVRYRLPVLSAESGFAEAGGLMNYGDSIGDAWRRAAAQVDKILKGAKPGDLPVEQPTKFELAINLKTAKALGLTMPPSLLLRADRVIE
jgi:putative tryptophan/tyrosine transport system substrate-binding protein